MTLLWQISGAPASMEYLFGLEDEQPPRFELVNAVAFGDARRRVWSEYAAREDGERELMEFEGMTMPVYRIADAAFRLDFFWHLGLQCASLRLRQALGLTDAVVRYRDIGVQEAPPAVRAQRYQALHVVPIGDPIDWSRTAGQSLEVPQPDGSTRERWFIRPPNPVEPPNRIYWRDDFTPPAPLFRAVGTAAILATDALADRVMRAGITDLVFQDVTSDRAQTELVLRQA
jgi:hypothetical protein